MQKLKISLILLPVLLLALSDLKLQSATVTADRLNLRAAPKTNSEIVGQLRLGQSVNVMQNLGEWVLIQLPADTRVWVHSRFVQNGESIDDHVNIRAGAGLNYSVIGQLAKGAKVTPTGRQIGEWLEIEATPDCFGFASSRHLDNIQITADSWEDFGHLKSEAPAGMFQTQTNQAASIQDVPETHATNQMQSTSSVVDEGSINQIETGKMTDASGDIVYRGYIERNSGPFDKPGTHLLFVGMRPNRELLCYLQSDRIDLRQFEGKAVEVKGVEQMRDEGRKTALLKVTTLKVLF